MGDVAVWYFLFKQVHFVQKQDDWYVLKYDVVHNRLEDVPGLLDSVRLPVLQKDLVVLWGWGHEENTGDGVKTLEPLLSLGSLAANIDKEEGNSVRCNYVGNQNLDWGTPTCLSLSSSQSHPSWFSCSRECPEGLGHSPLQKFYQGYSENIALNPSTETRFS